MKKSSLVAIGALCLVALPLAGAVDAANAVDLVKSTGLSTTGGAVGYKQDDPTVIAGVLIRALFTLGGTLFVTLMVYAGAVWMTAQGDSEKIKKARSVLRNAILGLVLMYGSYLLVLEIVNALLAKNTKSSDGASPGTTQTTTPPSSVNSGYDPTDDLYGSSDPDDPLGNIDVGL